MLTSDAKRKQVPHVTVEDKIRQLTSGLPNRYFKAICSISSGNIITLANYIQSMKTEINLSDHYKRDLIFLLCKLSKYYYHKPYEDLKRDDIIAFLNSFVKPEESDPLHKWIGTYNIFREHLQRFFKWLHYPNIEPIKRSKPSVVENIPRLKRKEQSIYRPSDLWTTEDDWLFLKFCLQSE
jgi:hypothetical protein